MIAFDVAIDPKRPMITVTMERDEAEAIVKELESQFITCEPLAELIRALREVLKEPKPKRKHGS